MLEVGTIGVAAVVLPPGKFAVSLWTPIRTFSFSLSGNGCNGLRTPFS
jgi:hypothetical protein